MGGWFEVLECDLIPGVECPSTKVAWLSLLKRIELLHSNGYVHGDILPRNLVFSEDEGYIIDFDLMRQEGGLYVRGYNHLDFVQYRHPEARAQTEMKRTHDVHALAMIGIEYFGAENSTLENVSKSATTVQELVNVFKSLAPEQSHNVKSADPLE